MKKTAKNTGKTAIKNLVFTPQKNEQLTVKLIIESVGIISKGAVKPITGETNSPGGACLLLNI